MEELVSELLFQALNTSADGAFIVDKNQRIIYWNQAAERALGHPSSEVLGRPCYEMLNGQDGCSREICRENCAVMVSALGGGQVIDFDMPIHTRLDSVQWINMSTFVLHRNGENWGTSIVHLFRNITQRKRDEELLYDVLRAAERLRNERLSHQSPEEPASGIDAELTDREGEVLSLLAHGWSTGDMAEALSISQSTVRNHIRNILTKFQVHSRLEAVLYALSHGLVTLDQQK
jgi:PAS domain S-box-containing protein